jgi:hypothetical protein
LAVERIAAAAEAARALPFPFTLTARAHNFAYANPDLGETIGRLKAFEEVGADVLFAPGLPDLDAVRAVCGALSKPFNFMAGIKGKSFSVDELGAVGVRRISPATSLYRAAMTGFLDAAPPRARHRPIRFSGPVRNNVGIDPTHAHLTAPCTSAIEHKLDFHRSSTSLWLTEVASPNWVFLQGCRRSAS